MFVDFGSEMLENEAIYITPTTTNSNKYRKPKQQKKHRFNKVIEIFKTFQFICLFLHKYTIQIQTSPLKGK